MKLVRYICDGGTRVGVVVGLLNWKPRVSEKMDYAAEMGVVIGKGCRYVSVDDARSVVHGHVAAHDEIEHLGYIENKVEEGPVPTP